MLTEPLPPESANPQDPLTVIRFQISFFDQIGLVLAGGLADT